MKPLPELWTKGFAQLARSKQRGVASLVRENEHGIFGVEPPSLSSREASFGIGCSFSAESLTQPLTAALLPAVLTRTDSLLLAPCLCMNFPAIMATILLSAFASIAGVTSLDITNLTKVLH